MNMKWILPVLLFVPTLATAAPIYGDVTVDGGIHFSSDDPFLVAGFWSPVSGLSSTLENEFEIPDAVFDGHRWVVDFVLPTRCGGTFQVDAWWHGGWWGEVRPGVDCGPPITVCAEGCVPSVPVSEPPSGWLLVAAIAGWLFPYHRMPSRWRDVFAGNWR